MGFIETALVNHFTKLSCDWLHTDWDEEEKTGTGLLYIFIQQPFITVVIVNMRVVSLL